MSRRIRNKVYPYPVPRQVRPRKTFRIPLRVRPRSRFVRRRIRIRVPNHLPVVQPSYVSVDRNRINIFSARQRRRLFANRELNRRRYEEKKTHRRKARHGQLDSVSRDRFGIIGRSYRKGRSINGIGDAALVSRAIEGFV